MKTPPGLAAVARLWRADAALCLRFERGRAAAPAQALRAWLGGLGGRLQRWRRMGSAGFGGLLQAEAACARAGLNYPSEDAGQTAPWHLPERFWNLPAAALPAHPVVDPATLADATAAQALMQLAQQGAGSLQWQHLPLLGQALPASPPARVAVCLHLFYPELWPLLHAQLRLIPEPWDLFVTVPHFAATPAWQQIAADQPRVRFVPLPNRGRDVAPWLHLLRSGALDGYDAVCKLHGKRSPHMQGGDAWRDALWQALVGDGANVAAIVARFRADPALGLLGPAASWRLLADAAGWAKNKHNVDLLAKRQGLAAPAPGQRFFAGTMFWFRPAALAAWRESPAADEFPLEMGQTEGTLAHAVERCIALGLDGLPWRVQPWPSSPTDT